MTKQELAKRYALALQATLIHLQAQIHAINSEEPNNIGDLTDALRFVERAEEIITTAKNDLFKMSQGPITPPTP